MFRSFFCNLFNCQPRIFSAYIGALDGFESPLPLPDIEGWTVYKSQQSEIYEITHNLGLTNSSRQLHIVATPDTHDTIIIVKSGRNGFEISTWGPGTASKSSGFSFIAVYRP